MVIRKKQKRPTSFNKLHEIAYGLRVAQRNNNHGTVLSVACRFCSTFGRQVKEQASSQRTPALNIKLFKPLFRTDHFRQYLIRQHAEKWAEYQTLDGQEAKDAFFEVSIPFVDTIPAYFGRNSRERVTVDRDLVEQVVGTLLCDPEDIDAYGSAMLLFRDGPDQAFFYSEFFDYNILALCLDCLSVGVSFREVTRIISGTGSRTGLSYLGGISERKVASFARLALVSNLEKLTTLMQDRRTWEFSVAFEGATCNGTSFLDLCVRLFINNEICNYHLLSTPMFERHTGQAMFELVSKLVSSLCYNWRYKLLSVTSDGARNMTGMHAGTVSRIERETYLVFIGYRVEHTNAVQKCVQSFCNETFYNTLTGQIGYLRRQQNLVGTIRSTCHSKVEISVSTDM